MQILTGLKTITSCSNSAKLTHPSSSPALALDWASDGFDVHDAFLLVAAEGQLFPRPTRISIQILKNRANKQPNKQKGVNIKNKYMKQKQTNKQPKKQKRRDYYNLLIVVDIFGVSVSII